MSLSALSAIFRQAARPCVLLLLALHSCGDSSSQPTRTPISDASEPGTLHVLIRTSPAGPEYALGDRKTRDSRVLVSWITADGPDARVCVHANRSVDSGVIAQLIEQISGAGIKDVDFVGGEVIGLPWPERPSSR